MNDNKRTKITSKDCITIGIYAALYFVGMLLSAVTFLTPVSMLFYPSACAFFGGIVYMILLAKIPKKGTATILSIIIALVFLISGHYWAVLITNILCGMLADLVAGSGRYKSYIKNTVSFCILGLGSYGANLPMFLLNESYIRHALGVENGQNEQLVGAMKAVISPATIILSVLATILCAFLGCLAARYLFKKHLTKAGVITNEK